MKSISPLTYRIVAYAEIPYFDTDECIDWAIEMMGLGYESESLFILAGLPKPTNYFDTIHFLKSAISELGLTLKTGESAVINFCIYKIILISKGVSIKDNLSDLCGYCVNMTQSPLFQFCMLYWAWGDLGCEFNDYYPDANFENIEQFAIDNANKWLTDNTELLY